MTLLWLSFALLAFLVVLSLALPVIALQRRGESAAEAEAGLFAAARDRLNIGLFRARSAEVEREAMLGTVDPDQVARLQGELQQVLLGDVAVGESAMESKAGSLSGRGHETEIRPEGGGSGAAAAAATGTAEGQDRVLSAGRRLAPGVLLVLVILVVPLLSGWLYSRLGSASAVADALWLVETQQQIDTSRDMAQMLERLTLRLQDNPDSIDGWVLLGRSLMSLERHDEAAQAFARVGALVEASGQNPAPAHGLRAQALFFKEQLMTAEVRDAVATALRHDPQESNALSLLGIDAFHRQDYASAIRHWEIVLGANPEGANAEALRAGLERARALLTTPPGAGEAGGAVAATPSTGAPAAGSTAPGSPALDTPGSGESPAEVGSVAGDASLLVTVTLAAEVAANLTGDETVFVLARPAEGSRMPLAVTRTRVAALPLTVRLDDSMAMGPMAKLSSVAQVEVVARVSMSGGPIPAAGDLEGRQGPLEVGPEVAVAIEIDQRR